MLIVIIVINVVVMLLNVMSDFGDQDHGHDEGWVNLKFQPS